MQGAVGNVADMEVVGDAGILALNRAGDGGMGVVESLVPTRHADPAPSIHSSPVYDVNSLAKRKPIRHPVTHKQESLRVRGHNLATPPLGAKCFRVLHVALE